mgnify:CR=1 FL=1
MAEATANSKEKNEIKVSTIILPENKNYESESLKYEINIPNWLLEIIQNYEVSNKKNDSNQDLIERRWIDTDNLRCARASHAPAVVTTPAPDIQYSTTCQRCYGICQAGPLEV